MTPEKTVNKARAYMSKISPKICPKTLRVPVSSNHSNMTAAQTGFDWSSASWISNGQRITPSSASSAKTPVQLLAACDGCKILRTLQGKYCPEASSESVFVEAVLHPRARIGYPTDVLNAGHHVLRFSGLCGGVLAPLW